MLEEKNRRRCRHSFRTGERIKPGETLTLLNGPHRHSRFFPTVWSEKYDQCAGCAAGVGTTSLYVIGIE